MGYEYILGDNLETPLRYQYTPYRGVSFMRDWYMSRKQILDQIDADVTQGDLVDIQAPYLSDREQREPLDAKAILQVLLYEFLHNEKITQELRRVLDGFVKTFEVRKRLYTYYSESFRPQDESDYHDTTLYTIFACACAAAFAQYDDMRYLNVLLKVNDTLLSQWDRREDLKVPMNMKRMAYSITKEMEFILDICRKRIPYEVDYERLG